MSMMLPVDHSTAMANGAADTDPVSVSGIASGDVLLAVVAWDPTGSDPEPLATTDYTVAAGTITGATIDSSGKLLWVMWCTPRE